MSNHEMKVRFLAALAPKRESEAEVEQEPWWEIKKKKNAKKQQAKAEARTSRSQIPRPGQVQSLA